MKGKIQKRQILWAIIWLLDMEHIIRTDFVIWPEIAAMKRHIPNALTLMNLMAGCAGLALAAGGDTLMAAWMILLAGLFDVLDGMIARLLHVSSPLGKELDSLADVVSFGVLPGFILYDLLQGAGLFAWLPLILIPALSALRLARFNTDVSQSDTFLGLPTPASALLLGTWPLGLHEGQGLAMDALFWLKSNPMAGVVIVLILALLMVSPFRLMSLKSLKSKDRNGLAIRNAWIVLALLSLVLILVFRMAALSPIILLYILVSLVLASRLKPQGLS